MFKTSDDIHLRMSDRERILFENSLSDKPVYLEFGCGGSTEIACEIGCPLIVSVESDRAWVDKLSMNPKIASRLLQNSLKFIHVDIGPVGEWGMPLDESKIRNWPEYGIAPFATGIDYKYVLVDGRFRNTCAYIAWAFLSEDAVLAVHDYSVRQSYFPVEKFFEVIDRADTLVLFKKKKVIIDESYVMSLLRSLFDY